MNGIPVQIQRKRRIRVREQPSDTHIPRIRLRTIGRYTLVVFIVIIAFTFEYYGMHIGSLIGSPMLIRLHSQRGGQVSSQVQYGPLRGFPLYTAALHNQVEVARSLIQQGADVNQLFEGKTALYAAAFHRYVDMVVLLLVNGAQVDASGDGKTPLIAAATNHHVDVMSLLIQHGADVNSIGQLGLTPLLAAILQPHPHAGYTLQFLLDQGASIDQKGIYSLTPLSLAAIAHNNEIVSFLINHQANLNLKGFDFYFYFFIFYFDFI